MPDSYCKSFIHCITYMYDQYSVIIRVVWLLWWLVCTYHCQCKYQYYNEVVLLHIVQFRYIYYCPRLHEIHEIIYVHLSLYTWSIYIYSYVYYRVTVLGRKLTKKWSSINCRWSKKIGSYISMDQPTVTELLLHSNPLHYEGKAFWVLAAKSCTVREWPWSIMGEILTTVFNTYHLWELLATTSVLVWTSMRCVDEQKHTFPE